MGIGYIVQYKVRFSQVVEGEAGLFKSQKRAKQETNGEQGLSIKGAHLLGDVADPKDIEQS